MSDNQLRSLLNLLKQYLIKRIGTGKFDWITFKCTDEISFKCYETLIDGKHKMGYVFFIFLPNKPQTKNVIEGFHMVKRLRQYEKAGEFHPSMIERYLLENL